MDFYDLWCAGCTQYKSAALENSKLVRSTPGILYGADGWTDEAGNVYICIFDASAAVASANPPLTWPSHIIEVDKPGNGNFGLTIPPTGENYKKGVYIGVSTTKLPNYTESASSKTHFNVQHGESTTVLGGQP